MEKMMIKQKLKNVWNLFIFCNKK